ncbi:MAG: tRNA (adenosine(37)-N6)-threonylcarbamoyltransferase complex dimerization subunit type 1 TsaB [Anaerolinea sp.]|nr:tRNA (adenosine(37)-N6)-threonylcarbamoyltransferase complex dimerization subunit type 1 TsaB [Anaerolinea sp.]
MTTILAIDTASNEIALAVAVDGVITSSATIDGGHDHSRLLLPAIDAILHRDRHALTGIAVVRGPGSYAGLRVGVATAQGLALAAGIPLRGISTLEAVAAAAGLPSFIAIHPAGRGEFAAQEFADGEPAGPIRAVQPEALRRVALAGEGAGALGGLEIGPETRVRAALGALLPAFETASAEAVDAIYLREPNITVPRTSREALKSPAN